jgi:hypothetical protein
MVRRALSLCTPNSKACRCTLELNEVCGEDGKSFGNPCMAKCAGVKEKCKGPCPCRGMLLLITYHSHHSLPWANPPTHTPSPTHCFSTESCARIFSPLQYGREPNVARVEDLS